MAENSKPYSEDTTFFFPDFSLNILTDTCYNCNSNAAKPLVKFQMC